MGRKAKIGPELEPEVLSLAAQGWSSARIAKRLETAHGIRISGQQVGELVRKHRSERADVAKVVVREHLERTLPADLEVLDKRVRVLTELVEKLEAKAQATPAAIPDLLRASEQLRKLLDLKLHYVGADQPDTSFSGLAELVGLAFK